MKVSEYTPRLHVQILTSPAAFQTNGRTSCQPVTEAAVTVQAAAATMYYLVSSVTRLN